MKKVFYDHKIEQHLKILFFENDFVFFIFEFLQQKKRMKKIKEKLCLIFQFTS